MHIPILQLLPNRPGRLRDPLETLKADRFEDFVDAVKGVFFVAVATERGGWVRGGRGSGGEDELGWR